jgi:hypothetical protein
MKAITITAVIGVFLATAATALALREEMFGNAPFPSRPGWAAGVVDVVNLDSRIWLQEHALAGTVICFYKGDMHAVNLALRKFAAVKAGERPLVLLPGPGKPSLSSKPIEGDWQFYVSGGIIRGASTRRASPPVVPKSSQVLTVYINSPKPRGTFDREKAEMWIADLDDDSFPTRQAASRALEKLGLAVKPLLRETLKADPSAEVRRRIDALLAKFKGFDADDLEIPDGLTLVTVGDLMQAHLKDLSDPDQTKCGIPMSLAELAPYSDKVVPALTTLLEKDKDKYIRRNTAWRLGAIGAAARSALPALKAGLDEPDPEVRTAFQTAIDQIEKARPEPGWEAAAKRRLAIAKDLDERPKKSRTSHPCSNESPGPESHGRASAVPISV